MEDPTFKGEGVERDAEVLQGETLLVIPSSHDLAPRCLLTLPSSSRGWRPTA